MTIRDGPLDLWGGGWANTKKKFQQNFNQGKKYLAQENYREKIVQKRYGFRTIRDILYVFHTKIAGFYIKSEMN
jgi:hypothetical protein